jgi:hypothetical protein
VGNEPSNCRGANLQPRVDNPGSIGAPAMEIDDHLACFTPIRSQARTPYGPLIMPKGTAALSR